jgi:hypothetical protein
MNKYKDHLYIIPEDDRDRQIADGFVLHHAVDVRWVQVMALAGGWSNVLKTFQVEYIQILLNYPNAHVVMHFDFDGHIEERRNEFEQAIPDEFKDRVFVIGAKDNHETLKKGLNTGFEEIGTSFAS